MAAINIDVGANTRRAERDIQKLVSRSYNINLRTKGDQPLGRITGKVNEFTKSLDASNARVIAFGASAGIIFGVQRAFEALASSVIDTQKSLQDINVILNVSSQELNKFGANLFNIAKNTGQSFQEVAKAATEFSRQGLGVTETLKRTNEALILSRLSGLDAAKSVEALTAAVNSYASQAVTATEIVNKFANVDAAFAVSSADLAEALSRVGSSAAQSGVSLNELIAIVTSAQQTTARGGAVIGNSFKTIFTRLQRTKVIDLLEGLGIDTRTASGEIKSTINLLTDLAKVYDQLGTLQQAEVAEKVGGVFQINILKAALADLGKEYSIYNSALNVAASTTDQAIRRNEELNKTYAAQLNALRENAKQLGAGVGERLFGPAFDRLVGNANEILGGINESDGQGVGAVLGKGILDGLGQVIAGPGLALIGGIFIKLFSDLSKFATGSIKELLGLNTASKQQQALQQSIASILQKNPELFKLMQQGTAGLNKGAEILLSSLRAQTLELQKQEAIAAKIAAQFLRSGNVRITGGVPVAPTSGKPGKAAGYIPNFASDKLIEKYTAISLGATPSVRPMMSKGTIGGKKFVMNNQEIEFPGVGKNGDSMVIPTYGGGDKLLTAAGFIPNFADLYESALTERRDENVSKMSKGVPPSKRRKFDMFESDLGRAAGFIPNFADLYESALTERRDENVSKMSKGVPPSKRRKFDMFESDLGRAAGFIPNFAIQNIKPYIDYAKSLDLKVGSPSSPAYQEVVKIANRTQGGQLRSEQEIKNDIKQLSAARKGTVGSANALKGAGKFAYMYAAQGAQGTYKGRVALTKDSKPVPFNFSTVGLRRPYTFEDDINEKITPVLDDLAAKVLPEGSKLLKVGKSDFNEFIDKSAFNQIYGRLFEAVINRAIGKSVRGESGTARFEFFKPDLSGQYSRALNDIFNSSNISSFAAADLKFRPPSPESGSVLSFVKKMAAQSGVPYDKTARIAAQGYIPNFASAISRAKRTENKSNGNSGAQLVKNSPIGPFIKTPGQSSNLNTLIRRDHPEGLNAALQTSLVNQGKGKAKGFIPNFAAGDTEAADLGSSVGALAAQFGFLAFGLQGFGDSYKQSLTELIQKNKEAGRVTGELTKAQKAANTQLVAMGKITGEEAKARGEAGRYGATGGQKFGAAIGAAGIGLTIAAPIIAETIANAIGRETKEARTGSAAASGLGQALSFAGIGAMLAPNPLIGAAIGGVAGGLFGLIDVIKQASTDIPELAEAARKASENLTKINDAGQKVQTGFEQIQGLRESGQVEKAGELETELLRFVRKEFRDIPEFSARIQTAIENNDTKALQNAINENTKAVLENSQAQERNLLIGKFIEDVGGKDASQQFQDIIKIQDLQPENLNKLLEFINKAQNISIIDFGEASGSGAVGPIPTISEEAIKLTEELQNLLISIGVTETEAAILAEAFRNNPYQTLQTLLKLQQPASDLLDAAKRAAQGSRKTNKVIDIILTTLEKVQSNYKKLASQTQTAFDLQLTGRAAIRSAKSNIKVSDLETEALQEELFAVPKRPGQLDKKTESELTKINEDFSNNIQKSIDQGVSAIGSALISQLESSIAKLSELGDDPETAEKNALANLQSSQELLKVLQNPETGQLDQTVFEKISKILEVQDLSSFEGFDDIDAKVEEIAKLIGITNKDDEESQKRLGLIREALNKINTEFVKNKAVLIEQKRILANQKFGENLRELITSLNSAFGGLQAFINDDISISSALNKAIANLKVIGEPTGEASFIEVGRNLQRVLSELSRVIGANIGPALEDSEIIKAITDARALDIENQLQNIIKGLGGIGGERGQELIAALRETLEKRGIENAQNLSLPELIKAFAETAAERQVQTENAVGKIDKAIINQARANLPPELQDVLGDIDLQFLPTEDLIKIQFAQANETLSEILEAIRRSEAEVFNAKYQDIYTAASGFIPQKAMPAMIAETIAIKDRVGGALPTDRPEILRNFNGEMIVKNSGEKLKRNFMGTGEDALLTREMQNMAKGYLPSLTSPRSTGGRGIGEGLRSIEDALNTPEMELQRRIREIEYELSRIPKPGEFGYQDVDGVRRKELEKELFLLKNPKAKILTRDGVKKNPYFDGNGKYIGGKSKKKKGLESQIKNMAEGYLPSLRDSDGGRLLGEFFNSPEAQLKDRIREIELELFALKNRNDPKSTIRKKELEKELFLLRNPKAEIWTKDRVKRNPYFDENGKYIGGKNKKKKDLKSKIKNMAEGYIPDKKYLMGRTTMSKATKNLDIPLPISPILKAIGGVMGRFANPIGLASSAYSFMDNFGGLPWSDESKKPKEMSPKDMPDYLKEYRTGSRPKFDNFAEGYIPIEGDVNEDLFRQLARGISGGSIDLKKRIKPVKNKAEGYIPPNLTEVNYDLIKRANELNRKYAKEYAPIEKNLDKTRAYLARLDEQAFQSFAEKWIPRQQNLFDSNPEEAKSKFWYEPNIESARELYQRYRNAIDPSDFDYDIYSDATSAISPEIQKAEKAIQLLSAEKESILRGLRDKMKSESLRKEFENIDVDPDDFISPELTSLSELFEQQKRVNTPRRQDKLTAKAAAEREKRKQQRDRERAKTEEVIRRGREVLARSYDRTGDRYDIDEYAGEQFTVDAERLGLKGPGAGGTFNRATAIDRAGLEPPEIRRAERTTKANAKFMLQALVEAYSKALSGQEGFYNRPTGASMDQKRAITAKIKEFKRLYEQGRYESLREVYEKHEKFDPVKTALNRYKEEGIGYWEEDSKGNQVWNDSSGSMRRSMEYAVQQEALYQRARTEPLIDEIVGIPQDQRSQGFINGRPTREVLAELREQNRDINYENAQGSSFNRTDKIQELSTAIKEQGAKPLMYAGDDSGYEDYLKKRAEELGVSWYAKGFLPKMNSFMAEMDAGFSPNEVYQKRQPEVQGLNNPEGFATFNKPQEGNIIKERMAMANRMYMPPPNFANSIPESSPASISLGGLTINEAQTGGKSKEYAADFAKEWESRAGALALQIKDEIDQKYRRSMEVISTAQRQGKLPNVPPRSTT